MVQSGSDLSFGVYGVRNLNAQSASEFDQRTMRGVRCRHESNASWNSSRIERQAAWGLSCSSPRSFHSCPGFAVLVCSRMSDLETSQLPMPCWTLWSNSVTQHPSSMALKSTPPGIIPSLIWIPIPVVPPTSHSTEWLVTTDIDGCLTTVPHVLAT